VVKKQLKISKIEKNLIWIFLIITIVILIPFSIIVVIQEKRNEEIIIICENAENMSCNSLEKARLNCDTAYYHFKENNCTITEKRFNIWKVKR